jgi:hypothetical protein
MLRFSKLHDLPGYIRIRQGFLYYGMIRLQMPINNQSNYLAEKIIS